MRLALVAKHRPFERQLRLVATDELHRWRGCQIDRGAVREELPNAALNVAQNLSTDRQAVRAAGREVVDEQVVLLRQDANGLDRFPIGDANRNLRDD